MPGEAPSPGYAPPPSDAPPPPPPAGGDYPPPGAGYPPPGGASYPPPGSASYPPPGSASYPPPGYPPQGPPGGYYAAGPAPSGYANNDEKTWALVAHFGGAAGAFIGGGMLGWVGPLVALLAKGNQSPTVRAHAIAALNFQLLWSIITVVSWILVCVLIGFILAPVATIIAIVFGIIGGVKANDGQVYRYPMTVSIIK
ncbi:hypothetical protein Psuf_017340 [Phytohabitans suffuscus]|uniref:DUF4870 domain-containing protein n=2 Tax=Phytohabitans suffuscus TaxID=624315 RepID=A0A6F8YEP8_9ACTN|nr:hypothetical protein Psuf_017340 [Phytohabitans suffuscus]